MNFPQPSWVPGIGRQEDVEVMLLRQGQLPLDIEPVPRSGNTLSQFGANALNGLEFGRRLS